MPIEMNASVLPPPPSSIRCLHYQRLPGGVTVACPFFHFLFHSSLTVDSLSNKKQMGDFCCRLQPNGANSQYTCCKLCISPHLQTHAPFCHLMRSML